MPLIDLSTVTEALRLAIREGVAISSAWSPNPPPTVETIPPEDMTGEGLTWYLYGVGESSLVGNQPGRPADRPLGLELHYQLSAHGGADPPTTAATEREHLLLGLAMKTLHNLPRLDAGVSVGALDLFAAAGIDDDNSMSIVLNPTTPEQAVAWWNASRSGPRAAAYYTVAVALVQEQPVPVSGPPVLVREVFGFAGLAPVISGTATTHRLATPGRSAQPITTAPAQVVPGGTFEINGSGFSGDITVNVEPEGDGGPTALAGASVRFAGGAETITTSIDRRLAGRAVVPGLMKLWVTRHETRTTRTGETVVFGSDSNQTALQVVPALDGVTQPGGAGTPFEIAGGPFADPAIDPRTVRLMVGADELTPTTAAPLAGEFRVAGPATIEFVPAGVLDGPTRVRVVINGAENLPHWMVAP